MPKFPLSPTQSTLVLLADERRTIAVREAEQHVERANIAFRDAIVPLLADFGLDAKTPAEFSREANGQIVLSVPDSERPLALVGGEGKDEGKGESEGGGGTACGVDCECVPGECVKAGA